MRTYFECLPCFVNQALGALKRSNCTETQTEQMMRAVFSELSKIVFNSPPPLTAQKIFKLTTETICNNDPYKNDKKHYNELAALLLHSIKEKHPNSELNFEQRVKFAIAANIIDFGKNANLTEQEVISSFERGLNISLEKNSVSRLKTAIESARSILYLCDNAGEIVFDRFLIEMLPHHKITCAVRGMPVINDATLEDADSIGLSSLVKTISNGSDAPGTVLEHCSKEFRLTFENADLIIAKGQGNFETLSDIKNKNIFFLLQVKCPVIVRDIGYPVGTFVVKEASSNVI